MSRFVRFVLAALAVCSVCAPAASASRPVRDEYVVVLKPGSDPGAVASEHGRRLGIAARFVYRSAIRGYAAHIPAPRVAAVRGDARVQSVAPVYPLDPIEAAGGGGKPARGQLLPTNIDRIDAERSTAGRSFATGPAVAVMDQGVDVAQPDLNVAGGVNCAPDRATNPSWTDTAGGHGTHVAGTIGARDDGAGVVGVAPGVPIYSVRVVQESAGTANTTEHLLCGLDWIAHTGAPLGIKVVNASLGYTAQFGWTAGDTACGTGADPVHEAVCAVTGQGITFVASMGNSTTDLATSAPAVFDEVLSVAAVADFDGKPGRLGRPTCSKTYGSDDAVATFSNFATPATADWTHSIAAPGVCVTSDAPGGGTAVKSGTSMASPAVAGTVALCIATAHCSTDPAANIAKLRADAFAHRAGYGYTGEPASDGAPTARYYGPLVWAGGYR